MSSEASRNGAEMREGSICRKLKFIILKEQGTVSEVGLQLPWCIFIQGQGGFQSSAPGARLC